MTRIATPHWPLRFAERDAGYVTPCLEWTGPRNDQGYGVVTIAGRKWRVHRLVWTEAHGDPGELHVLHRCDNPPCGRLDHLFAGTPLDNMRDAAVKGRTGIRPRELLLTEAQVAQIQELGRRGLYQYVIARRMGLSQSMVNLVLTGKRKAGYE